MLIAGGRKLLYIGTVWFTMIPLMELMYRCSREWRSIGPIWLSMMIGFAGKRKVRSLGVPMSSCRSYSSSMWRRSSSDFTVTKASRSSGIKWYFKTTSPSSRLLSFRIRSVKMILRGTEMTRVSPPTYLRWPSEGRGRILPPWLQRNLTLFLGDPGADPGAEIGKELEIDSTSPDVDMV